MVAARATLRLGRRGTRRWIANHFACLLVVLLVPAGASAALAWQPPQLVSGVPAFDPTIVMSDSGHALAVWLEGDLDDGDEVRRYAWRSPHGGWGASQVVPGAPRGPVAVDLSSYGEATLAYGLADGRIAISKSRAGQTLSQTETLPGPKPILPTATSPVALAVDDEGGATVAWIALPKLFAASRVPGGRFGKPQKLEGLGVFNLSIAVNPAGAAVVTWGVGSAGIEAAYRLPGETRFGRTERVPALPNLGGRPLAAVKADGTAIVASSGANGDNTAATGVTFSERSPVGKFQAAQRVDVNGELQALVAEPQSASSFVSNVGGVGGPMTIATRTVAGLLGAPTLLSSSDSCEAQAATNPLGLLVVAYSRPCVRNFQAGVNPGVEVRRRDGAGAFDEPVTLTTGGQTPDVAINGSGDAIVAWPQGAPARTAIVSSAFEDPAAAVSGPIKPVIGGGSKPVVTLPGVGDPIGLPVTCPVACSVTPEGIITTDGKPRARSMTAGKRRLRTRKRTQVRVRFSKTRLRQARRALKRGDPATISYTVAFRRRSGSKAALSFSRRVRLRLPRSR